MDIYRDARVHKFYFDMCQYREPQKKSTGILTNNVDFTALHQLCHGSHSHQHLVGTVRVKIDGRWQYRNRTYLAASFPYKVCLAWAQIAAQIAPEGAIGPLGWRRKNDFILALSEVAGHPDDASQGLERFEEIQAETPSKKQPSSLGSTRLFSGNSHELTSTSSTRSTRLSFFGQYTRGDIDQLNKKFGSKASLSQGSR